MFYFWWMILWINGTFGVGKTTTSELIVKAGARCRVFDPETVGSMLHHNLRDFGADDFQDLQPWRRLVPQTLSAVHGFTGADLVAPQTVLVEDYWTELHAGMTASGLDVFHVVLDCDEATLRQRIETDEVEVGARQWRLDHLDRYRAASRWMNAAADLVLDTTQMSPSDTATAVLAATGATQRGL